MTVLQITPPAIEPISIADARQHLRVETSDEDNLISALIVAARSHVEAICGVVMISQKFRQFADDWSRLQLSLERFPVQQIEVITIYDDAGDPKSIELDDLEFDGLSRPPRVMKPANVATSKSINGIEIDFIAGYGLTSLDVPEPLRRAVLELVGHWYEFRGAVAPYQQPVSVPPSFEALVAPYRSVHL